MADRSVRVTISAQVQGYIDGMNKASQATREVGSEGEKLAKQRQSFEMVGASALAMGTLAAAGVALAVSKWADFDQAMSNVQAATMESEANMKLLSDAALEAGGRTVFSAEEAANAIEELAKAGVSTADILNGALDGALDLAAAGGLGVAEAAGIAAVALKTFNLEGDDMAHVADLLAAGAGKAMGDVTDLSSALNQSAMVANATGLSIEETTAALSAFAAQGLMGSDAGTSFKSMLQSLTPTSAAARDTMEQLGIKAYDAQGNFIGLAEFAGNLKNGLKDLTVEQQQAALKTIFGSDAIRAATVLYSEGEEGVRDWIKAVDDQGYAAEQAAARLDNLKGDLEAMSGALDTALIKTGSAGNDALRGMVQAVTDVIDGYNNLPAPLQGATLAVGAVTAAVGLLSGAFFVGLPKYVAYKDALKDLGPTAERVHKGLAGIGKGLAVIAGGLAAAKVLDTLASSGEGAAIGIEQMESSIRREGLSAAFTGLAEDSNDLNKALELLLGGSFNTNMERFGSTLNRTVGGNLSDNVQNTEERFRSLGDYLAGMVSDGRAGEAASVFDEIAEAAKGQGFAVEDVRNLMPSYVEALSGVENASADATAATDDNAEALAGLEGKAASTTDEIENLADVIRGLGSAQFDVREANRKLEESVVDLNGSLAENGLNLDITTEAGRKNEAAIDSMAQAVLDQSAAVLIQTGSQEAANAAFAVGKERLIDILTPYYGSRDAAAAYVETLGLIEPTKVTEVVLKTETATARLNEWLVPRSLMIYADLARRGDWSTPLKVPDGSIPLTANGGLHEFADGGFATGIYKGGVPIHKFAEPETRWEAYISGKPGQEDRNRQIWVETGRRLGMGDMGAAGNNITVNVTAAPGMDESAVADRVVKKLEGLL